MGIIDIFLILAAFTNGVFATILFIHHKEDKSLIFLGLMDLSAAFWVFEMFLFRNIDNLAILIWPAKMLYVSGIFISMFFFYFTKQFSSGAEKSITQNKKFIFLTLSPSVVVSFLILFSGIIINNVFYFNGQKEVGFGNLYIPYSILMAVYFLWGYYYLFLKYIKEQINVTARNRLLYIIISTVISIVIGVVFDIIMPYFRNFSFYWLGPAVTISFVVVTTYAILKHRLYNMKLIATEFFTFAIWIATLVQIFYASSLRDRLLTSLILFLLTIFGIFLIKSVYKEVEQKEKLQALTIELQAANEKLVRLDKLKSEFLSFAAHQVKSPMSVIKGYAELILDGTIKITLAEIKAVAQKIKNSSNKMISLVNNLLDARRIEEGRMEYSFEKADIVEMVKLIANELKPLATDKKLEFSFESKEKEIWAIIDAQKLSQVVQNLVDNAIKYTAQGWVKVSVKKEEKDILISVSDSGAGISKEAMSEMFKQFSRGDFKERGAIQGTGLGLYIAKQIISAHQGEIWAESEGKDKGSSFFVKIPIAVG